jgi:hypothetical protein
MDDVIRAFYVRRMKTQKLCLLTGTSLKVSTSITLS